MYSSFNEKRVNVDTKALSNAAGDTWDSFLSVLPYLLIILICIVVAVFLGRFYSNLNKITKLGSEVSIANP